MTQRIQTLPLLEKGKVRKMGVVHTSVHSGSSISTGHNLRLRYITDKEGHINPKLPHETWHHEDMAQAYEKLFGQAIRDYNARQKRKDRRLDENYMKTVQEDPLKHIAYEYIVGVYPQEDTVCPEWVQKEILRKYVDEWQERNPNLYLVGAYYHADEPEAGIHIHLDYIPVGHFDNYGMPVQNSLSRALKEQGLELKPGTKEKEWRTAQMQLQDRERDYLDALCREHGLVVEHPVIEGKEEKRVHLETETYKAEKRLETAIEQYTDMERLADEQLHRADREDARARKAVERAGRAQDAEQKVLARKKELKDEIKALKGDYDEQVGIQAKTAGKTLLGRPKKKIELDYTEYQALTARANAVTDLQTGQRQLAQDRKDVETLRQSVFRQKDETDKRIEYAKKRHDALDEWERNIERTVEDKVQKLLTEERTATEKAMRAYMKGFDVNGRNMLEIFDEQEKQRRLERQHSRGWER